MEKNQWTTVLQQIEKTDTQKTLLQSVKLKSIQWENIISQWKKYLQKNQWQYFRQE